MKCPICTGIDLKIADRQGIEIDYCPECRGVWLDRGELDKIIERSSSQPSTITQPQPQYQQSGHNQQRYAKQHHENDDHGYAQNGHYKKKNWLTDLFD